MNKSQAFAYPVRCLTAAFGFAMLIGCTGQSSSPSSGVTGAPTPKVTPPDSTNANRISSASIYQPGQLRYALQISSVIQASAGDSSHRIDSTRVAANVLASFAAGVSEEEITASVQPESLSTTTGAGTSVPMLPGVPLVFRINIRSGHVVPNNAPRDCDQDSVQSALQGTEVLASIPLLARDAWTDTSTTATCRGGVLLILTRVASYTQLQSPDRGRQLLRSTRVSISGTGYQWGQKVDVSGDGNSVDTLRLGGLPPRLQQLTGSSRLRLQFRAPLKTEEFIQTAATRLSLQQ
jgi:hypothetical protein